MGRRTERLERALPLVLIDANTQRDFLDATGSYPVLNRPELIKALRRVVAWSKRNQVPVISCVDCHRREEVMPDSVPLHCIDGTPGQRKVPFTIFGSYVKVEGDSTLAVPCDLFDRHQQVIFRKRTRDFFLNPKADRFVTALPTEEYVIAGLGVESAIKAIALGLLARNKKVSVVTDACGYWDPSEAEMTSRLLEAKGITLITAEELSKRVLLRPVRYPRVSIAQIALRNGLYASISSRQTQEAGGNGVADENGTRPAGSGSRLNGTRDASKRLAAHARPIAQGVATVRSKRTKKARTTKG
jgi:nicotinamidase-related amidase